MNKRLIYEQVDYPVVLTAQRKVRQNDGLFTVGNIISLYTKPFNWNTPPEYHTETGFFVNGGLWFFSSVMGIGTRWISAGELLVNSDEWNIYAEIYKNPKDVEDMIDRSNDELGKGYDYLGLAGFGSILYGLSLLFKQTKRQISILAKAVNREFLWYCSEVSNYVTSGKWLRIVSPRRYTIIIKRRGAILLPQGINLTWWVKYFYARTV
jgi:hypothetical protein